MSALFISLLTLVLILISAFVILLVLMQRTSQSGGMGAALGGGAAESAFGSDTNNILTKSTIYGIIAFFLVALSLFLIYQSKAADRSQVLNAGELISADEVEQSIETLMALEASDAMLERSDDTSELPVEAVDAVLERSDAGSEALVEEADAVLEGVEGTLEPLAESAEAVIPVLKPQALSTELAPTSN